MTKDEARQMIREATDLATPSIRGLAESGDLSRDTINSWRNHAQGPRPDALRRLAAALRIRGSQLEDWGRKLERVANELESSPDEAEELEGQEELELAS